VTYAYAHLDREIDSAFDYSDYSFWYDTLAGSGAYFYDDAGAIVNPSQVIHGVDKYGKQSHELRITRRRTRFPLRRRPVLAGADARHLAAVPRRSATSHGHRSHGWPDTIWLTNQARKDKDQAIFGEMSYDFNDHWTATVGAATSNTTTA
jgi:hypothetical protein